MDLSDSRVLAADLDDLPVDSMRAEPHHRALDGIRGVAILLVMLFHFSMYQRGDSAVGKAALKILSFGWVGVDVFFALSGFLITGILLRTKTHSHYFKTFYARRALRIFPLYYAVIGAIMLAIAVSFGARSPAAQALFHRQIWLWTYSVNIEDALQGEWVFGSGRVWLNHFWSLAVEEQFYLCWPLLVFLLRRRALACVAVGMVLLAPLLRAVMVAEGAPALTVYSLTFCRFDALALGSLAALVVRDARLLARAQPLLPFVTAACAAVLFAIVFIRRGLHWLDPVVQVAGLSPLALLAASTLVWVSTRPRARATRYLESPALCWFGKYSYGLYVLHYLLWPLLVIVCPQSRIAEALHSEALGAVGFVALGIAVSSVAALASYHGLERHFLDFKRHFPSDPARA